MSAWTAPSDAPLPLDGLRVVEGGSYVAVPSGGATLAMLGADVIRFDPIGGASDHQRAPLTAAGDSLYWASLNKGKRSIALDLRGEAGREIVRELISAPGPDRGLFLTNAVGRGWLSYESLRQLRADLIMVHVTGYADGAPAVDYTVNCEIGFPAITGAADGPPTTHALPAWDLLAGMHATVALLAAERRRRLTGEGDHIAISLADVALAATDNLAYFAEVQMNDVERDRTGSFVYGTFGTPFETADGRQVMVVALTERQWTDLVTMTGTTAIIGALEEHLAASFSSDHDRYRHRALLYEVLSPWFVARTAEVILEEVSRTRVLASRFQTFRECLASPAVQDNALFTKVNRPDVGAMLAAGVPSFFRHASGRPVPVAPTLGADTEQILSQDLGLGQQEIGRLHDDGVVASTPDSDAVVAGRSGNG